MDYIFVPDTTVFLPRSGEVVWELRSAIASSKFSDRDRIWAPYAALDELCEMSKNLRARRKYRGINVVSSAEQSFKLYFEKSNAILNNDRIFRFETRFHGSEAKEDGLKIENNGDRMLAYAIKQRNENMNSKVILLTNDTALSKKSQKFNVQAMNVKELQDLVVERYMPQQQDCQEHPPVKRSRSDDEKSDSAPALDVDCSE